MLLDNVQIETIETILSHHGMVSCAYYFGSRIQGTHRDDSDVDICIKANTPLPRTALIDLQEAFSDSDIVVKIDLVDWHGISDEFKQKIKDDLMPVGWRTVKLGEVCEITPRVAIKKNQEVPFIDMALLDPNNKYVHTNYTRPFKSGTKFNNGDTLMARITPCLENGKIAQYKGVSPASGSTEFNILRGKDEVTDNNFIYYFSISPTFHAYAVSHMSGTSGRQRCSAYSLCQFVTRIPNDINEQKRIADILSALDDTIENNRRMNETLEAMAKAIFKSWFIDYDPVHALSNGEDKDAICRRLKIDRETLDLFPDTFGSDGLPAGWEMKPFSYLVNRQPMGKKYDNKIACRKGNIPILDQGKSGIIGYHNEEAGVDASPENPIAVFANHTCYKRLVYYPFSAIQNVLPYYGKAISTVWVHYASLNAVVFSEYKGHWPEFMSKKIVVPNRDIDKKFEKSIIALLQKTWKNEQENQTLAKIRDTLLPQLISGKVRV